MSWIDRIEWAVEKNESVSLKLPWQNKILNASNIEEKCIILNNIRANVKNDPALSPDDLATCIQLQCNLPETWSNDDPLDLKLTWPEVKKLANDPLFLIGGHTHTHAILSFLDDNQLAYELDTSITFLKKMAGVESTHYSYPEGLAHCYSNAVIKALKTRGVLCCPSAIDGVNTPNIDLFNLKRISVV